MRVIVNLHPLARHEFWVDGRQRRSALSAFGALRIAPMHENAWAEFSGEGCRFAQICIPREAMLAVDRPAPAPGITTVFEDPCFDRVDPLVTELVSALLGAGSTPDAALYRDHLALALLARLDRT
jgi:hypothetical protein